MGKSAHILALLGLLSMGRGEPSLVITKTVGGTTKPVGSRVTVKVGMYVKLACKVVDGDEEKANEVTWSKRTYYSSRFQSKKTLKPYKDSIVAMPEPSTLQLLPVTLDDRGTYICLDAAHNQSKLVFVNVQSGNDSYNKPKRNVYDPENMSSNDPDYALRQLLQELNKQDVSTSKPFVLFNRPVIDWSKTRDNKEPSLLNPAEKVPNFDNILKQLQLYPSNKQDASKLSTSESSIFKISPVINSHMRDDDQPYQLKPEVDISNYDNVIEDLLKKYKLDGIKSSPSEPSVFNNSRVDWNRLGANKWPSVQEWEFSDTNRPSKFNFDIPTINFTLPEFKYDDLVDISNHESTTYEYKNSFRHFYYTVPVSIIVVVVGVVRLCFIVGRRTDRGWQRLTAARAACSHRVCTNQRTTNPSAGCLLEGRGAGRLSVLIVHRITAIAAANERANNAAQDDAPPSYDDSTRNPDSESNELPPSYNEALATMSSNAAGNLHEATDSASVATPDVLPMPHSGNIQQRV